MNRTNYFPLELDSENMIRINYIREFKKNIRFYSIRTIKLMRIKIKFLLKKFFIFLYKLTKIALPYKLIKKYIPYSIKIYARCKLANYPTLINFIKKIISILKNDQEIEQKHLLIFFKRLAKKIILGIFLLIIRNIKLRTLLYKGLKRILDTEIDSNSILENYLKGLKNIENRNNYIFLKEKLYLSSNSEEIYQKMKFYFINNELNS
jgi:hypothetical protein